MQARRLSTRSSSRAVTWCEIARGTLSISVDTRRSGAFRLRWAKAGTGKGKLGIQRLGLVLAAFEQSRQSPHVVENDRSCSFKVMIPLVRRVAENSHPLGDRGLNASDGVLNDDTVRGIRV